MTAFSSPQVKKALKVAIDMGMTVAGYEITPEGGIKVFTAQEQANAADTALNNWIGGRYGKGND